MLKGYGPDDLDLFMPELIKTQAFQRRFPGYSARIANGYNAIQISDYLQLEDAYHEILQRAGLPAGFYDSPGDYAEWIANSVSPNEISDRVNLAVKAAQQVDPTMRNLMARFYGLTTGDVASYFLDAKRALPIIERQYNSAGVAAWAARAGFTVDNMGRYESLVDAGVTPEQAAAGYSTIRDLADTVGYSASVYGESFNQSDAESDVFFNNNAKRRRILAQEAATFGGSSQGATGSARRNSY
jgi:hypothetical protein